MSMKMTRSTTRRGMIWTIMRKIKWVMTLEETKRMKRRTRMTNMRESIRRTKMKILIWMPFIQITPAKTHCRSMTTEQTMKMKRVISATTNKSIRWEMEVLLLSAPISIIQVSNNFHMTQITQTFALPEWGLAKLRSLKRTSITSCTSALFSFQINYLKSLWDFQRSSITILTISWTMFTDLWANNQWVVNSLSRWLGKFHPLKLSTLASKLKFQIHHHKPQLKVKNWINFLLSKKISSLSNMRT